MACKDKKPKPGQTLTTDYHRSHLPKAPKGSTGWGPKRYIHATCRRDDDDRHLSSIPFGIRHPHPRLNPPCPHTHSPPVHDVDGHAWGCALTDFCYLDMIPVKERTAGLGALATCSRSQL
jgi:hypothetical protein